jgi:hypothetical protein
MTAPAAQTSPAGPLQREEPPPARPRHRLLHLLLDGAVVAVVTALLTTWLYRLWAADLDIPLTYPLPRSDELAAGDATFHQAVVTALLHGRWWTTNPQLGAPYGQQLYDFPLGPDRMHVLALRELAQLTGNAFTAVNLYFLGCYVVIALVAWAVCRHLGLSRPMAVAVGVLFAFAPFHQGQGEAHLFLAAYYAVPLGALLLNWQLSGFAAWGPGRRPSGLTWRRAIAVLLVGVVVGSASAYFAFFALVLLALVAIGQAVMRRATWPLASVLLLAGVPSVALLYNLAPAITYQMAHGPNLNTARPAGDSWVFAMDLTQLVSPIEDHRIPALAALVDRIQTSAGWMEPGNSVGVIGVAGLAGLAVLLARRLTRRSGPPSPGGRFREHQAALALLAVLLATAGGLSLLVAVAGLTEVRVWARMAVYVDFFVLCAVGSWVDAWFRARRGSLRLPRSALVALRWAVAALLVVVGVLDQTPPGPTDREYRATAAAFSSDARFGAAVTRLLGPGSAVFQLPVLPFPESGLRTNEMYDYDELRGYLHAPGLQWSYGGVKGRPQADWQIPLAPEAPGQLLVDVAAAGFSGLYIDRAGYVDGGTAPVRDVQELLGEKPLRSHDGRLVLFDLRPLRKRLVAAFGAEEVQDVGRDVTAPPAVVFGAGFYPQLPGTPVVPRWSRSSGRFYLENPTDRVQRVTLGFSVSSLGRQGWLNVAAGGTTTRQVLTPSPGRVVLELDLLPGRTRVQLSSDVRRAIHPDPRMRDARFVVSDLSVVSVARTSMAEACAPVSATPGSGKPKPGTPEAEDAPLSCTPLSGTR